MDDLDARVEERAKQLIRQARLRGGTDPPPPIEAVVDEKIAACRDCQQRASNQRTMLAAAVVAAVGTICAAALTVWSQHTAEKADAKASANLESRLANVQRQLNRQSRALEDLGDQLRRDRRELELRIASRAQIRDPDLVTR